MAKGLYTKLLVAAIAFSFFGMAFGGFSGFARETQDRLDIVDIESFTMETRNTVDESIIKEFDDGLRTLGRDSSDLIESQPPGEETKGLFEDGFETYAAGAAPPDPPWYTDAPAGGTWPFWEDNLEDDILGENPDADPIGPWETTDAGWDGNFFYEDWEDYTLGTAPQGPDWWANVNGDATLGAVATPGGGPVGSMSMALDEGVGGDSYCVISADNFGPATGFDQANIEFWVYTGPDQTTDADFGVYFWSTAGPAAIAMSFMSQAFGPGTAGLVWWCNDVLMAPGYDYIEIFDDTWYHVEIAYDLTGTEGWFDIIVNGVGGGDLETGPYPFIDTSADTPETLQIYGGDDAADPYPSNHMIDELRHYVPVPGGTQDIYIVDTYSSSWDGGTQSMFMEQNSEPVQAFTEASFGPPYMFGTMMNGWFFVQTETVATSDGAVFYFIDFAGSYLAGFRFNGGNIEYYSAGGWVIAMAYADATEYIFEFEMNDLTQEYNGIWINSAEQALNVPMGENGAGIAGFRMEGTPGTPSRIWADYPGASGGDDDSIVEVSTDVAHTGLNSLHIYERGATAYTTAEIAYDEGYGVKYGEFSFWFNIADPVGGGDILLFDSTGSNLITWISIGTDLGGGEHPGTLEFIDNDGMGLWIIPGPSFTVGTWNNLSIRYDINADTFDVLWNSVVFGTYGMYDLGVCNDFFSASFRGDQFGFPAMPLNIYYDDVSLWIDDPPAPPTDVNTAQAVGAGPGGVPVVEGSQISGDAAASASLVLDAPAGITPDELLLLIAMNEDATATPQFSDNLAGWNFVADSGDTASDVHIGVFWRIADGTEGASVTITAESSDGWMGFYARISGADTAAPIHVSNFASAGNSDPHNVPSITTTTDDCLAIYGLSFDGGDGTPFSVGVPWTEQGDIGYGAANGGIAGTWGTLDVATAGGTGNAAVDCAASDGGAFFQLAIAPPTGSSPDDIEVMWTLSTDDGAGANDVAGYNIYGSDAEIGGTFLGGPWALRGTVGAGVTSWFDTGEYLDAVNNIWYFVTAFDTYGTESVDSGNASKFNVAPVMSNVLASGLPEVLVPVGTIVTVTANVYDDSSTWEDIPKMDEAEWYDDFVGDPGEGAGTPMTIVDGVWNWPLEMLTVNIDTAAWGDGESHLIYVRGHEAGPGNTGTGWGTPIGVWVNTTSAPSYYDVPIDPTAGFGDWVFVSFPVEVSGSIETVLNDTINGDFGTTWDIAKWYDASDQMDPWKTYSIYNPGLSDMPAFDQTMGVWLRLLSNGGNFAITLGVSGTYSAAPVVIQLYAGWNLVGYPTAVSELATDALFGTGASLVAIWTGAAPYISDEALADVTMLEGNAYWVLVPFDTPWTVNQA